jgi:hypothetical protein
MGRHAGCSERSFVDRPWDEEDKEEVGIEVKIRHSLKRE